MRVLHTMLRVGDMDRSIAFYTEVLGMTLLRRKDYPGGRFTLAFVGYGNNPDHAELELTYNWGTESYEMGTAYGHIALGVPDAYAACEKIKAAHLRGECLQMIRKKQYNAIYPNPTPKPKKGEGMSGWGGN